MTEGSLRQRMRKMNKWQVPLIGTILGAVLLAFAAYGVDWRETVGHLRSIDSTSVLIALLISQSGFLIRAYRWKYVMPGEFKVTFGRSYQMLMVGHMGNLVLPARLGELARAAFVRSGPLIDATLYVGTIAAEHVLDLLVILAFLGILILGVDFQILAVTNLVALFLGIALLVILLRFLFSSGLADRILEELRTRGGAFGRLSVRVLLKVRLGMQVLFERNVLALALMQTVAIWTASAVLVYVMGSAILPEFQLAWGFAVAVAIALSIALPAAPAYIGAYEFGVVLSLSYFDVPREQAMAVALATHSMMVIGVLLAGFLSFLPWLLQRGWRGINLRPSRGE